MLNEAINREKGIITEKPKEIKKNNVSIDAYIPQHFSDEDYEKIKFYQNIDKIQTKSMVHLFVQKKQTNGPF